MFDAPPQMSEPDYSSRLDKCIDGAPSSYETHWDAAKIREAISACQSCMSQLDRLARECADCENIEHLVQTMGEHAKWAKEQDSLRRHVGKHEMVCLLDVAPLNEKSMPPKNVLARHGWVDICKPRQPVCFLIPWLLYLCLQTRPLP